MESLARWPRKSLQLTGLVALVLLWHVAVAWSGTAILPTPGAVVRALVELFRKGLLHRHIVASLFRVTWGYFSAVLFAVPLGLLLGWSRRGGLAFGPLLQVLRPISPLAWIPFAILWFGVGDLAAIFIIALASFWPITVATMNTVRNVPAIHINAGRNFGLTEAQILRRVVWPSVMPQIIVGLRLALGIAWLVDVAAEMIAVNSGLGFLVIDSRNMGNRYDLVVAGMVLIGAIGLFLDLGMRRLERPTTSALERA